MTQLLVDASVHPFMGSNSELREYLPEQFRSRGIPDVESLWYQAPGGDYHPDLYGGGYPGSDPATVAGHLFDDRGTGIAILDPLTRGNLPDRILNNAVCSALNDWLAERWLTDSRFRGTIRVNPEDPPAAVEEIDRWAADRRFVQVGVPLQSREPYGKPQFEPIWAAAASARLPVAVHPTGGAGIDHPPSPTGHPRTYAHHAAFMPLNYFHHLSNLIVEGVFERIPELKVVFSDGGADLLVPLIWRLDGFARPFRDQVPWLTRQPSEYLTNQVRFCIGRLEGPLDPALSDEWYRLIDQSNLLMFASNYPAWSLGSPADLPPGLSAVQRRAVLWKNADELYRLGLEDSSASAMVAAEAK
jgi:predicted TIM-barrel fold metal-dependent hydrolase